MGRSRGFSLIEAMVGIAVGMIAVLIISQTFMTFEGSKQTTLTGADAQENALMAINQIEQDLRNAGVGLAEMGLHECNAFFTYDPVTGAPIAGFTTAPVTITDGGAGGSDTIVTRTASFLGSVPAYLAAGVAAPIAAGASLPLDRDATLNIASGDLVLVEDGGNCVVLQVDDMADPKAPKLKTGSSFNPPVAFQISASPAWPSLNLNAKVFGFGRGDGAGPGWSTHAYSVGAAQTLRLAITQLGVAGTTQDTVRNVVSLQAQYGIADANSESVNGWVDATGEWAAPDVEHVRRIKAVRVTVVTRSQKREPAVVTAVAPAPGVDAAADWDHYRYKAYTTTVALRNVLWPDIK